MSHANLVLILFVCSCLFCSTVVSQSTSVPSPSPFTVAEGFTHSTLAWDYGVLGESTGWWGYWYPSCGLSDQSPIDVLSASAVDDGRQLSIQTYSGEPLSYVGVIVAFDSIFNHLHVDLSQNDIILRAGYGTDVATAPNFTLAYMDLFVPSVHTLDGVSYDGELVYHLIGSDYDGTDVSTTLTGTDISSDNAISLHFLLEASSDSDTSSSLRMLLTQIINGAGSGSSQLTPLLPDMEEVYHYPGTQVHPPCYAKQHVFVSSVTSIVDKATLSKVADLMTTPTDGYRSIQSLGTRTITKFGLNLTTLFPSFNTAVTSFVYRMVPTPLRYTGLIQEYFRNLFLGISLVLFVTLIILLVERYTYRLPYNLTWLQPSTKSEVFGVPIRYGYETGNPKVDLTAKSAETGEPLSNPETPEPKEVSSMEHSADPTQ